MSHRDPEGWGSLLLGVGMGNRGKASEDMDEMTRVYLPWGECSGAQSRALPASAPLSARLGLGASRLVSSFQRIPNSILIGLVQERLSEDDCLRRVRLCGTAWLGVVTRIRGEGCVHL